METVIHHRHEFVLYSPRNIEPAHGGLFVDHVTHKPGMVDEFSSVHSRMNPG